MKDDLISRSAIFHELLVSRDRKVCPDNDPWGSPNTVKVQYIKEAIRNVPAADVRPERHGRWTDTSINLYDGSSERGYQCNVCKDIFFVEQSEIVYYKFCPHCGTKMDGKENTNE